MIKLNILALLEKKGKTNQGRVEPEKLYPYLAKRLDLEAGVTDRETSLNQMSQELQKLREGEDERASR